MQNTILQHIQLPKPKNVVQIWLIIITNNYYFAIIAKEKNNTLYNKNVMSLSYQLKGALQLHLFLHHFLLLELFIFSKFICLRGGV